MEAGTYSRCIECRVHACTTLLERCIFAASSIDIKRQVFAKGARASPSTLMRFATTSARNQALLRRRTKMPSVLPFVSKGAIHAWIICSAPTTICGRILFTSSLSLTNAASATALLLSFNGFRRSICRNCRLFKPAGRATKPRLSDGDNLQHDSSMFIRITVLSPTPSVSMKLCHLQVANACYGTKFHRQQMNKATKSGPKNKPGKRAPVIIYLYNKVLISRPLFGLIFGAVFLDACQFLGRVGFGFTAFARRVSRGRRSPFLKVPRSTRDRWAHRRTH